MERKSRWDSDDSEDEREKKSKKSKHWSNGKNSTAMISREGCDAALELPTLGASIAVQGPAEPSKSSNSSSSSSSCSINVNAVSATSSHAVAKTDISQVIVQSEQRHNPLIQGCRSVDEYQRINYIDQGTYGLVFKARCRETGELVALKQIKLDASLQVQKMVGTFSPELNRVTL
jgi:cell division cycle 2-like protein